MIAYKLYKRVFSIFGLSLHLRTDGQASLFRGCWPALMKLLGVEQLVGTAMSSSSNGICERKIKELRRMFKPIMDRGGAMAWKMATISVQVAANNIPNEAELSPEQLVQIPTIGDDVAETHRKIVLTLTTSPCVVIYSTKQCGNANT